MIEYQKLNDQDELTQSPLDSHHPGQCKVCDGRRERLSMIHETDHPTPPGIPRPAWLPVYDTLEEAYAAYQLAIGTVDVQILPIKTQNTGTSEPAQRPHDDAASIPVSPGDAE